jgi:hypothetical protein
MKKPKVKICISLVDDGGVLSVRERSRLSRGLPNRAARQYVGSERRRSRESRSANDLHARACRGHQTEPRSRIILALMGLPLSKHEATTDRAIKAW